MLFDTQSLFQDDDMKAEPKTAMRVHTLRGKAIYDKRRFSSEARLLENIDWHFGPDRIYHVISGGDCDSLTFLRHVVRQQPLDFCLVSSWCYGVEDVSEMGDWQSRGLVRRFDFYCGEIAKASYAMCSAELGEIARRGGETRDFPQPFQGHGLLRQRFRRRDPLLRERKHEPEDGADRHRHPPRDRRLLQGVLRRDTPVQRKRIQGVHALCPRTCLMK